MRYNKGEVFGLRQFQCTKCGILFYMEDDGQPGTTDLSELNPDFGCPHGCDAPAEEVRDLKMKIIECREV